MDDGSIDPTTQQHPFLCDHTNNSKAKRDSYMGLDVFYWTILYPGTYAFPLSLCLICDPCVCASPNETGPTGPVSNVNAPNERNKHRREAGYLLRGARRRQGPRLQKEQALVSEPSP